MRINKTITGERIFLRCLTIRHATKRYAQWLNDPQVNRFLATKKATIASLKKFIEEKNRSVDALLFGIFDKKTKQHIGNVKLEPIERDKNTATIGILIGDTRYWGGGYGREAMALCMRDAFSRFPLDTIELGVRAPHAHALASYKKLGFSVVNIEKNGFIDPVHGPLDQVTMRISRDEFQRSISNT